jgi:short-subunit dehydrogenase
MRAGATVVLHGRIVRKLEAVYDEIVGAGSPEPIILPLDLAVAKAEDFANVANALQAQRPRRRDRALPR